MLVCGGVYKGRDVEVLSELDVRRPGRHRRPQVLRGPHHRHLRPLRSLLQPPECRRSVAGPQLHICVLHKQAHVHYTGAGYMTADASSRRSCMDGCGCTRDHARDWVVRNAEKARPAIGTKAVNTVARKEGNNTCDTGRGVGGAMWTCMRPRVCHKGERTAGTVRGRETGCNTQARPNACVCSPSKSCFRAFEVNTAHRGPSHPKRGRHMQWCVSACACVYAYVCVCVWVCV